LTFFHKKQAVVFWKNGPKAIIFAAALEKAESMIQEGWRGRKRKRRKNNFVEE
jgi:hypothetical protein